MTRISLLAFFLTPFFISAQLTVTTVVGGAVEDGLPAASSHLLVNAATVCGDSSIYVSTMGRVVRITPDGILHTFAGTGVTGFSGDGGPASSAQVWQAGSISCYPDGGIVFVDVPTENTRSTLGVAAGGSRIRHVGPDGIIKTMAGNGLPASAVTDGNALAIPVGGGGATANYSPETASYSLFRNAPLFYPGSPGGGLVTDTDGSIYVAEPNLNRVRKIGPDGSISLFAGAAGNSTGTNDGDGGPAIAAHISAPSVLAIDAKHNVYIGGVSSSPYTVGVVRKVSVNGMISSIVQGTRPGLIFQDGSSAISAAIAGVTSIALDPAGNLYIASASSVAYRINPDGGIYSFANLIGDLQSIDGSGNIYFQPLRTSILTRLSPAGDFVIIAGAGTYEWPDGTNAIDSGIDPTAITVSPAGNLLFAESDTCTIRMVDDTRAVHTIAGTGTCADTVTPGPTATTRLARISGLAAGPDGTIYFLANPPGTTVATADPPGGTVYKVSTAGQISSTGEDGAFAIAVGSQGTLYVSLGGSIDVLPPGGTATNYSFYMNSPLGLIYSLTADSSGNAYVLGQQWDFEIGPSGISGRVAAASGAVWGAIVPGGTMWSVNALFEIERPVQNWPGSLLPEAATPMTANGTGMSGDTGSVESAFFNCPTQLAADTVGNLYVLDQCDRRIRRISGSVPAVAPSINAGGVVSSASYGNSFYTPGQMISIFGANLAYSTEVAAVQDNRFPFSLGGASVFVNNANNGTACPLVAVSPGQINAILPQTPQNKPTALVVVVDGVRSAPYTLTIADTAPGLFSANASGSGPGAIVNQDGTVNSAVSPAPAGTVVSLYGTGGGSLDASPGDGFLNISAPYGNIGATTTASVGGRSASVLYAGGAPFLAEGAFQLNVQIPPGTPTGMADVSILIGGVPSNPVSVWVR